MPSFHLIKLSIVAFFWLWSTTLFALTIPSSSIHGYTTFEANSVIFKNRELSTQNIHPPKAKVIPNLWLVKLRNKA
jgi:hypothetical protein